MGNISIQGDLLLWRRPQGRVSYYSVKVTSDGEVVLENTTNEQLLVLPDNVNGQLSVEVRRA